MTEVQVNLDNIRVLRVAEKLNQEDMANIIGCSYSTYQKKENGKNPFWLVEAKRAADYFGMTIEQLFFTHDVYKRKL